MTFIIASLISLFLALPALAVDITMGANGNLAFDPKELTVSVGEVVTLTNGDLPPHNFVVDGHPEFSHSDLAFASGDSFTVTFDQAGDYNFQCEPHAGAGMTGIIHVTE